MIYHAALPADWEAADGRPLRGLDTRATLADEGFIHAAYERQVEGVLNRYYTDVDEVVLLVIDRGAVGAPVIDETVAGNDSRTSTGRCPSTRSSTPCPGSDSREPGLAASLGSESRPDR